MGNHMFPVSFLEKIVRAYYGQSSYYLHYLLMQQIKMAMSGWEIHSKKGKNLH